MKKCIRWAMITIVPALAFTAKAECFDYQSLESGEASFPKLMSAGACIGYYARTQQQPNPSLFKNLEVIASVASVMENEYCPERQFNIGTEEFGEEQFKTGVDILLANAASVQKNVMSMDTFRARIKSCSEVAKHYTSEFSKMTK